MKLDLKCSGIALGVVLILISCNTQRTCASQAESAGVSYSIGKSVCKNARRHYDMSPSEAFNLIRREQVSPEIFTDNFINNGPSSKKTSNKKSIKDEEIKRMKNKIKGLEEKIETLKESSADDLNSWKE